MRCLHLSAKQNLAGNRCEATFSPCLHLLRLKACSGPSSASQGKDAGGLHASEDLPGSALCPGAVIQSQISGQGASIHAVPL